MKKSNATRFLVVRRTPNSAPPKDGACAAANPYIAFGEPSQTATVKIKRGQRGNHEVGRHPTIGFQVTSGPRRQQASQRRAYLHICGIARAAVGRDAFGDQALAGRSIHRPSRCRLTIEKQDQLAERVGCRAKEVPTHRSATVATIVGLTAPTIAGRNRRSRRLPPSSRTRFPTPAMIRRRLGANRVRSERAGTSTGSNRRSRRSSRGSRVRRSESESAADVRSSSFYRCRGRGGFIIAPVRGGSLPGDGDIMCTHGCPVSVITLRIAIWPRRESYGWLTFEYPRRFQVRPRPRGVLTPRQSGSVRASGCASMDGKW